MKGIILIRSGLIKFRNYLFLFIYLSGGDFFSVKTVFWRDLEV